jgi:two-component system, OmpR family, alkaline phosphatase synthesis response regulator PhoP
VSQIVIVEEDRPIATGLAMNLRYEGHEVKVGHDGPEGLRLALEPGVSLVVLDVMLPGLNGFEVLREIRRRNSRLPVLMLSAKGAEEDKVSGLDLGADDYVSKPFALGELLARVKALLRRARAPRTVTFGEVEVNLDSQSVCRRGEPVTFTPQEFRLLRAFIESEGRALSREQLLDLAWGMDYEGTARTVDTFIRQLRVKLEVDPEDPRHVQTVRGHGYRFQK